MVMDISYHTFSAREFYWGGRLEWVLKLFEAKAPSRRRMRATALLFILEHWGEADASDMADVILFKLPYFLTGIPPC